MNDVKRIAILGSPGSGKSFLARKLHEKTGIPLYPLDQIWWRTDKTHLTRPEFDARLDEILKTDAWILDGDYSRTYEVRIRACDTVLFLDFDMETCINGITQRIGSERDDCPFTEDSLDPVLLDETKHYREKKRPVVLDLLTRFSQKEIHVFNSREEAAAWVDSLKFQRSKNGKRNCILRT